MLRQPPPLDTPLTLEHTADGVTAEHDGRPVASARPAAAEPVPVEPAGVGTARAAEAAYPGRSAHPFPTCFACGTSREPGDGLRIFPGPIGEPIGGLVDGSIGRSIGGPTRSAATWTPHPSVAEDFHDYDQAQRQASLPVTWAALDCVGAWAADQGERMMVLGTMTGSRARRPAIGEEHVVVGVGARPEGRKTFSASALYDARGALVGIADHVWIAVDPRFSTEAEARRTLGTCSLLTIQGRCRTRWQTCRRARRRARRRAVVGHVDEQGVRPSGGGTRSVYQVYVRSFADSDGDGIGDLPGITSRLPYLRDLGIDAVWLTPFYTSPQHDHGYDVADYRDVDPLFGSLSDFDTLMPPPTTSGSV